MRLAIVIPAYNEGATIRGIAERALQQCASVFVIDDGSADDTAAALDGLPVVLQRHSRNMGKAASLCDGFAAALAAGAELVITLDGDGQHRPEDVPRLVAAAERYPHHLVIGARLRRRAGAPPSRRMANGLADFCLSWAAGHALVDSQSGQRAYPAELLRTVLADSSLRRDRAASFTLESALLVAAANAGYPTVAVPIDKVYLPAGRGSHFRPVRDIAGIAGVIVRGLCASRFSPRSLWRAIARRPVVLQPDEGPVAAAPRALPGSVPGSSD